MRAFRIVNVFTIEGNPFSGNPLCVFEHAEGLSDADMQALARQMNLSETTFVMPSTQAGATAKVRIFTPGFELPFAGHPTLGTASVVAEDETRVVLDLKAGLIPVTRSGDSWKLRAAKAPVSRTVEASRAELAEALGLPENAVSDEPLWIDTGIEQLVVPITTPDLVQSVKPHPEKLAVLAGSGGGDVMVYVWARSSREWPVRFFFTSNGALIEDAATGSACANLGGWLVARNHRLPFAVTLRQGDAVGRPSRLQLNVEEDGGIYVTGAVHELGRGSVDVDRDARPARE